MISRRNKTNHLRPEHVPVAPRLSGQSKQTHSPAPANPGPPLPPTVTNGDSPAADTPWSLPPIPRFEPPPAGGTPPGFWTPHGRPSRSATPTATRTPGSLLLLSKRLAEPTSTGLPDPFAPALRVLAQTLYGPS